MKLIHCLFFFGLATQTLAQEGRLLSRGSAYQQSQALDTQSNWITSKKLSLLDPIPNLPVPQPDDSLRIETLKQGQIGKMSYWQFKVADVVDEANVILNLGSRHRVWVEGFSTVGLVDDQSVRIIDYVEVVGTKSYDTVIGANTTVWLLKPLPKEESEKRIAEDLEFKEWRGLSGKTIKGKFLEIKNSRVMVEQKDGTKTSFPLSALTPNDRSFAIELSRQNRTDRKAKVK